jgi:hypothetical protein
MAIYHGQQTNSWITTRGRREDRRGPEADRPRPPHPPCFQEGDYFGRTVNIASRIADYARPGEVVVSREVMDSAGGEPVAFEVIGPVELKGVSGAIDLFRASHPADSEAAAPKKKLDLGPRGYGMCLSRPVGSNICSRCWNARCRLFPKG